MTASLKEQQRKNVEQVLSRFADRAERTAPGSWSFDTEAWDFADANVHLTDDWLDVSVRCNFADDARAATHLESLLAANRDLAPGARYAVTPDGRAASRVDRPVHTGSDTAFLLREALNVLQYAVGGAENDEAQESGRDATRAHDLLHAACTGTNWTMESRSETDHQLRAANGACHIRATLLPEGALCLRIELAVLDDLTPLARQAIAVLLLTAADALRMVRPVALHDARRITYALEYLAAPGTDAEEITHSLAALAVGHDTLAHEVTALKDEHIAQRYLTARGWAAPDSERSPTPAAGRTVTMEEAS